MIRNHSITESKLKLNTSISFIKQFQRPLSVQNATELGLKGWVRNRRDGSVEALFSGSAEKVGEMQERCRRGPPSAMVTGLDVNPSTEDPGIGFERRSTA
ncbi:acylphosphatase-like isoform X1 [Tanacetum coccineum]